MNCTQWTLEILERSRRLTQPSAALAEHLAACPHCAWRWESEVELSRRLRAVRAGTSRLRSPAAARQRLLDEFDRRARSSVRRPAWKWAAVAAAVVLALATATLWRQPGAPPSPGAQQRVHWPATELLAGGDFVPVPYAPPLAPGELVEVVRADVTPAALARMGVYAPAGSSEFTAEMMIGQDGLPRAVRVPGSVEIDY